MLVLTRKIDQEICVGDDIVIKITDIRGDKVRIGIDAPRDVKILRREAKDKIAKARQDGTLRNEHLKG